MEREGPPRTRPVGPGGRKEGDMDRFENVTAVKKANI